MKKIPEISFKDFNKKYMQPADKWDFSKFKIECVKCGSKKVEYAGEMETEYGYYGEFDVEHKIIVKCHDCGSAFGMKSSEGGSSEYCGDCHN